MLRKQLELPPDVAKAFVRDMRAFFRAKTQLQQDEIAAGTGWMLKQHLPLGTKLRLADVKQMFLHGIHAMTSSIRIILHEAVPSCGSFEVKFPNGRPSQYFYFDDIPGLAAGRDLLPVDASGIRVATTPL